MVFRFLKYFRNLEKQDFELVPSLNSKLLENSRNKKMNMNEHEKPVYIERFQERSF